MNTVRRHNIHLEHEVDEEGLHNWKLVAGGEPTAWLSGVEDDLPPHMALLYLIRVAVNDDGTPTGH